MIALSLRQNGKQQLVLGLTSVNLRRLASTTDDGSMTVPLGQMLPPGVPLEADAELLVFHATRDTCLRLADALGVPQAKFLDSLGEG